MEINMVRRVLVFFTEYELGGAEAQLRYIIEALETHGIYVDVLISGDFKKKNGQRFENDKDRFSYVSYFQLNGYGGCEYSKRQKVKDFLDTVNKERSYMAALIFFEDFTPLIPYLRSIGIRTIYSERLDALKICENDLYKKSLEQCDVLVANSIAAVNRMEKEFDRKVLFIKNGKNIEDRIDYIRKKCISNILVPCRISPIKNLDVLIDFAVENRARDYSIRFAGEHHYKLYAERLEERVYEAGLEKRIEFLGFVDDMRSQYEWADVVVLPSLAEGTPNVVLEAFMYGRAVITSDIEEERYIITDNNLRFSPKSPRGLQQCLEYLEGMQDSKFYEMLDKNYSYVKNEYSMEQMTNSYISLLNDDSSSARSGDNDLYLKLKKIEFDKAVSELEKKNKFYFLLCEWNRRLQTGKDIFNTLSSKGYHRIAIYGFKELGELLFQGLIGSGFEVCCIIDKDADYVVNRNIMTSKDWSGNLNSPDAVIVTAISSFEDINKAKPRAIKCPVISLEDVIFSNM